MAVTPVSARVPPKAATLQASLQNGAAPVAIRANLRIVWNDGEQVTDFAKLDALITAASASGGAERANYQLFIKRLCGALGLPGPDLAREENAFNDYVFERRIDFKHPDGTTSSGFIDCYRKHCFVLEAKQSRNQNTIQTNLLVL